MTEYNDFLAIHIAKLEEDTVLKPYWKGFPCLKKSIEELVRTRVLVSALFKRAPEKYKNSIIIYCINHLVLLYATIIRDEKVMDAAQTRSTVILKDLYQYLHPFYVDLSIKFCFDLIIKTLKSEEQLRQKWLDFSMEVIGTLPNCEDISLAENDLLYDYILFVLAKESRRQDLENKCPESVMNLVSKQLKSVDLELVNQKIKKFIILADKKKYEIEESGEKVLICFCDDSGKTCPCTMGFDSESSYLMRGESQRIVLENIRLRIEYLTKKPC